MMRTHLHGLHLVHLISNRLAMDTTCLDVAGLVTAVGTQWLISSVTNVAFSL